jgi:hypothetical protein
MQLASRYGMFLGTVPGFELFFACGGGFARGMGLEPDKCDWFRPLSVA